MKRILLTMTLLTLLTALTATATVPSDGAVYAGPYACDGADTTFTWTFGIDDDDDLDVVLITVATGAETALTKTTHYTLTSATPNDPTSFLGGGTVTTVSTYSSAYRILLRRVSAKTQTVNIDDEEVEEALDKLTRMVQDLAYDIARCLKIQPSEIGDTVLFGPKGTAGYAYRSADGDWSLAAGTPTASIAASAAALKALLHLDHVFDVRDFGAAGDGVADDTAEIQAAITAAIAAGGGVILLPAGTWRVTGTLDATGAVPVSFQGLGMLTSILLYDSAVDAPVISGGSVWTGSESRGWQFCREFQVRGDTDAVDHGTGIYWQSANPKFLLEHVYIRGMKYGLHTTSDWGSHYRDLYVNYATVGVKLDRQPNSVQLDGLYLQRCETGINADEAYQLSIRNCIIERKTTYSIQLTGGGPILVDACYFESDLAGDTTINVTRKSGISCAALTVSNCHVNNNSQYFVRGQAVDELRVSHNAIMTPPENHVLVLSDTQVLSNGIKHARIEGNTTLDYFGSGYDTTLKKYLCRELGAANPVRWEIGQNYEYTARGTVFFGSLNAQAGGVVSDMWTETVPHLAWDADSLAGFATDAESDALTAARNVADGGRIVLQITDGAGAWASSRYTRTIDLAALQARFGATGNLRVRARCLARNGYLCLRAAGLVSPKAHATQYAVIELEWTLDVASASPYRVGYQVADGEVGYFGPIDITIIGTEADRLYVARDWQGAGPTMLDGSIQWNPGNLADGAGETSGAITVAGAALGDFVLVSAPYDLQDCIATGYVQAADTVEIRLQNESTAVRDLADGLWRVRVVKL